MNACTIELKFVKGLIGFLCHMYLTLFFLACLMDKLSYNLYRIWHVNEISYLLIILRGIDFLFRSCITFSIYQAFFPVGHEQIDCSAVRCQFDSTVFIFLTLFYCDLWFHGVCFLFYDFILQQLLHYRRTGDCPGFCSDAGSGNSR